MGRRKFSLRPSKRRLVYRSSALCRRKNKVRWLLAQRTRVLNCHCFIPAGDDFQQ